MRVLGVGIATLDVVCEVAFFPQEDTEVRASSLRRSVGGNVSNTLTVLRQGGHACELAATLADCVDSDVIRAELSRRGIGLDYILLRSGASAPVSFVTLSRASGSRTIIHYRDLDEYSFDAFSRIDLMEYDWIHFEGRNVGDVARMLRQVKNSAFSGQLSLEIEKPREGINELMSYADTLIFSRHYIEAKGYVDAAPFIYKTHQKFPQAKIFCAWGSEGAYAFWKDSVIFQAAFVSDSLVDTLAAGDVFNAGVIHGLGQGFDIRHTLQLSCELAGRKCGQTGLGGLFNAAFFL